MAPGDCADAEAVAQTERNLRTMGFLRDARVETVPSVSGGTGAVDVRVSTFDTWTTVPRLRVAQVGNRRVWTFGIAERALEIHLFDFAGELYGDTVHVEWVRRLRDVQTFPSRDALVEQLARDARVARDSLNL